MRALLHHLALVYDDYTRSSLYCAQAVSDDQDGSVFEILVQCLLHLKQRRVNVLVRHVNVGILLPFAAEMLNQIYRWVYYGRVVN